MDDEARLWAMLETAWEPLGAEVARARRDLAHRTPTAGEELWGKPPLSVVEGALSGFLENLAAAGRDLPAEELTRMDRVVERLLHDIDRADVHAVTDGSDDGFLYARGFIVALGEEFYTAVTRDPHMAVLDAECERMCYFFARLHNERFGDYPDTGSGISRESCSNPEGWPASA
ncbi:DUF4240 domain-containing protein [Actinomadura graeca]|uniref:DUF4240 domain-containing protein n=1 Tax=Actinomadura graeca TaxID=2750812 RepID=A0ABX8QMI8_9ACTN|nr:DUF4240 domain-containing protein [Actinomadura graeca]QXJ19665.1 DUF4240 domain-containing protein [Actinomadura graeca]